MFESMAIANSIKNNSHSNSKNSKSKQEVSVFNKIYNVKIEFFKYLLLLVTRYI